MDLGEVIASLERLQQGRSMPKRRRRRPPGAKRISSPAAIMDLSKVLEELKAEHEQIKSGTSDQERAARNARNTKNQPLPPLETAGVAVRVPRPKPKLPPATVALPIPSLAEGPLLCFAGSTTHH